MSLLWSLPTSVINFFSKRCSSFTYLNVTQFLGALNDNVYKFLIIFFLNRLHGMENSQHVLMMAGAIFVIPFLLFSSTSGALADRWSKRNIIVSAKLLELAIMTLGVVAFSLKSEILCWTTLFLMSTQSAYFGPSKYGIVPELVSSEKISRANGLLSLFTFLAIILGTGLASFITKITGGQFILCALVCVAISAVGLVTSFWISYTPPAGSTQRINPFVPYVVYRSLRLAKTRHCLLAAVLGSSYIMFIAAFFQLNIIPFAYESFGLTDLQGTQLFLLTALGIGAGSMFAGRLSGKYVELGLIPIGGFAIIACYFLLDYYSDNLTATVILTLLVGIFGGFCLIPMDSYIQMVSPKEHRGEIVAAANFLGFTGVLAASGVMWLINSFLGLPPDKGFTFVGMLTSVVLVFITYSILDHVVRFFGMLLSRVFFKLHMTGHEQVPILTSSLLVSSYHSWLDSFVLMGTQRRCLRLYLETEKSYPFLSRFIRALRFLPVPTQGPLESNLEFIEEARSYVTQGISVVVFTPHGQHRIRELQNQLSLHFPDHPFPIISVQIDHAPARQPKRNPTTVVFQSPLAQEITPLAEG